MSRMFVITTIYFVTRLLIMENAVPDTRQISLSILGAEFEWQQSLEAHRLWVCAVGCAVIDYAR